MNAGRIEELVRKLQAARDNSCRDAALELLQGVMDLHAEGIRRMMDLAHDSGGNALSEAWAADELVSAMLLLHDLHPWDLGRRASGALARPELRGRGMSAELVSIRDGVIRVRIDGGPAFRSAVESALVEAAPDAAEIVIEGGESDRLTSGFVPLAQLVAR